MIERRMWKAVARRERESDGRFVYAVTSTGIYCRPSCPARRPRRENVVFFAVPDAAERAGYRSCHRCRPAQVAQPDAAAASMLRTCGLIESDPWERPTLASLAAAVGLSPYHLQRTFKRVVGLSPRQYAEAARLERFKALLRKGDSVTSALYEAGYGSSSRLYEKSNRGLGMTPAVMRKRGEGMEIRYALVDSALGRLLVAATEKGVCEVCLGAADAALVSALWADYGAARITEDAKRLRRHARAIVRYLEGRANRLDLPVDLSGTVFQRRVWQALRAIPYGRTLTYREIARALDLPRAARAVGRACATNKVAVVIPCHRAVGEDGKLRGYRWGIARKAALLEMERKGVTREATPPHPASGSSTPAATSAARRPPRGA